MENSKLISLTWNSDKVENIVIVAWGSWSGKTLAKDYLINTLDLVPIQTFTTRPSRPWETEYIFLSVDEFQKLERLGLFLETTKIWNNYYWLAKPNNKNCITAVNVEWITKIYDIYRNTKTQIVLIFLQNDREDIADLMNRRWTFGNYATQRDRLEHDLRDIYLLTDSNFLRPHIVLPTWDLRFSHSSLEFELKLQEKLRMSLLPQLTSMLWLDIKI